MTSPTNSSDEPKITRCRYCQQFGNDTECKHCFPTTSEWEKEFDEKRTRDWHYLDVGNEYTQEIKDFIRKVRDEAFEEGKKVAGEFLEATIHNTKDKYDEKIRNESREKERARIVKMIEELRNKHRNHDDHEQYFFGRDDLIIDLLTALKEMK